MTVHSAVNSETAFPREIRAGFLGKSLRAVTGFLGKSLGPKHGFPREIISRYLTMEEIGGTGLSRVTRRRRPVTDGRVARTGG